jgi:hypothetical protein
MRRPVYLAFSIREVVNLLENNISLFSAVRVGCIRGRIAGIVTAQALLRRLLGGRSYQCIGELVLPPGDDSATIVEGVIGGLTSDDLVDFVRLEWSTGSRFVNPLNTINFYFQVGRCLWHSQWDWTILILENLIRREGLSLYALYCDHTWITH